MKGACAALELHSVTMCLHESYQTATEGIFETINIIFEWQKPKNYIHLAKYIFRGLHPNKLATYTDTITISFISL